MNQAGEMREIRGRSRSQTLTGIGLFAALALVLNFSHIQVVAPYAGYLIYEIWEIPIVACLLIFGFYASFAAAVINAIVLVLVNPGALASGPIYNLIAVTVTLLAIVLGHKLSSVTGLRISGETIVATGLGITVRTVIMTIVNYSLLRYPPPLGFSMTQPAILVSLPFIAFFNATLALYTVPLGYASVRALSRRLHFRLAYPLPVAKTPN
jgi:riboflavin transporter FmnP